MTSVWIQDPRGVDDGERDVTAGLYEFDDLVVVGLCDLLTVHLDSGVYIVPSILKAFPSLI